MTDKEQIAAFLASKGATVVPEAPAYGVDLQADKERRRVARETRWADEAERRAEMAAEAFASGDREEGYAQMTGWRRTAPGRYVRA